MQVKDFITYLKDLARTDVPILIAGPNGPTEFEVVTVSTTKRTGEPQKEWVELRPRSTP